MKRDWELIREVLTKVEECASSTEDVQLSDFPDDKHLAVSYHVKLLMDAGLIKGQISPVMLSEDFFAQSLTWEGHEFLDSIRSDTVWEKTKKLFADQGVSMSIELVKDTSKKVAATILASSL